jgi:TonB family protein
MKRLANGRAEDRPPIDTPQSDARRLLKTGGVSLLFHLFLIFSLLLYLGGGGSGGGGDGGGGSSVYHVTIQPLSAQSNSNLLPQRGVVTKTHISTAEKKQSAPVPQVSTQETHSGDDHETELEDPTMGESVEGQGTGEGSGSGGGGDGTGRGFFGLKGLRGSNVSPPRIIENPKPVYPLEARQKGYEGKVLLRVEVLTNGRVGKVEVAKSSGYELLDQAALEAMKRWRFIPAKRGKVPFRSWGNNVITFQLRDSEF